LGGDVTNNTVEKYESATKFFFKNKKKERDEEKKIK